MISLRSPLISLSLAATCSSLSAQVPLTDFSFDTSTTGAISKNTLISNMGVPGLFDACWKEQWATVKNKGITNGSCQAVYIPALGGVFGSRNALQVNGTASHVRNASGQGYGKLNASGGLETCRSITENAQCWGATIVASDTAGAHGILNGLDVAVALWNATESYSGANSRPIGVQSSIVSSGSGDIGIAFLAVNRPGIARWLTAYSTGDSSAVHGLELGSTGKTASAGGQPIVLHYRDGSNVSQQAQINVDGGGNLSLTSGNGGSGTGLLVTAAQTILSNSIQTGASAMSCGSTTAPGVNSAFGNYFACNITSNVRVVVQPPRSAPASGKSEVLTIALRNSSGGALGTPPTFSGAAGGFKFVGSCNPANGAQCVWVFAYDPVQGSWYQIGGTPMGL